MKEWKKVEELKYRSGKFSVCLLFYFLFWLCVCFGNKNSQLTDSRFEAGEIEQRFDRMKGLLLRSDWLTRKEEAIK